MKAVFMVGASGAGKTTLVHSLQQLYLQHFGGQHAITINLDCANPHAQTDIDICDLISLEDIMEEEQLGPNGALLYASDFLLANVDWLFEQIQQACLKRNPCYKLAKHLNQPQQKQQLEFSITLFFDLPGQMQLYLQSDSLRHTIQQLNNKFNLQTLLLELFDSSYIHDVNNFISMCMASLVTGMNLELPLISILSKIDLLEGRMPANGMLQEYFKVHSLSELGKDLRFNSPPVMEALQKIIDETGRVSFAPCSVKMPNLLNYLIFHMEKIFGTLEYNMYANRGFATIMAPFLQDYVDERMISELESELRANEEDDWEMEIEKLQKDRQMRKEKGSK